MDYFISWESGKKEREGGGMEDEGEEEGVCKLKNYGQRQRIWNEVPGMALSDLCFCCLASLPVREIPPCSWELYRLVSKTIIYGNSRDTYSVCSSLHVVSLKNTSTKHFIQMFLFYHFIWRTSYTIRFCVKHIIYMDTFPFSGLSFDWWYTFSF